MSHQCIIFFLNYCTTGLGIVYRFKEAVKNNYLLIIGISSTVVLLGVIGVCLSARRGSSNDEADELPEIKENSELEEESFSV